MWGMLSAFSLADLGAQKSLPPPSYRLPLQENQRFMCAHSRAAGIGFFIPHARNGTIRPVLILAAGNSMAVITGTNLKNKIIGTASADTIFGPRRQR